MLEDTKIQNCVEEGQAEWKRAVGNLTDPPEQRGSLRLDRSN